MFLLIILQYEPEKEDDPTLFLLCFVGTIALLLILSTWLGKKEQMRVHSILAAKGHTDIVLTRTSMPLSDGDPTYIVEYTDPNGERHKNTCKLSSNDVFWKDPI